MGPIQEVAYFVGNSAKPGSVWSITRNSRHRSAANHGDAGLTRQADDKSTCVFTIFNYYRLLCFIPT